MLNRAAERSTELELSPFAILGATTRDDRHRIVGTSPVENPKAYRQEFLKAVVFFLTVMPLVDAGSINFVPDPCNFDLHLRDQMLQLAQSRAAGVSVELRKDSRMEELMKDDAKRGMMALSRDTMRRQVQRTSPELDEAGVERILDGFEKLKERDPLAVLQEGSLEGGKKGGQLNLMKLSPNFEITMYLAQATGSFIVTDNPFRWGEIRRAIRRQTGCLSALAQSLGASTFAFPEEASDILGFASSNSFAGYPALMSGAFKYLSNIEARGQKPNVEANLNSRFIKAHAPAQAAIEKARVSVTNGRLACVFPHGGIQDNTVNRLLLMSSSERHPASVPMAFFIQKA